MQQLSTLEGSAAAEQDRIGSTATKDKLAVSLGSPGYRLYSGRQQLTYQEHRCDCEG